MKRIFIIITILFSLEAAASPKQSPASLIIKTRNNEIFDLSKEHGKLVAVVFWVSWCDVCREELSALDSLYKNNSLQNGKKKSFEVIAVNLDDQDDDQDVRRFLKALNPAYKIARLRDATTNSFPHVTSIPTTYIINEKGVIREEFEIYDIDNIEENLKRALH